MNPANSLWSSIRMAALVACLFSVALTAHGQHWEEYYLLNSNQTQTWEYTALYPSSAILLQADPQLGYATSEYVNGKVKVTFFPEEGAVGTAEFVVEMFADDFPPRQITKKFRIYLDSTHVRAFEDYFTVSANSTDTLLDVLLNDQIILPGADSIIPHEHLEVTDLAISPVGHAAIASNGQQIVFTPEPDMRGMTFIRYAVCDSLGNCASADANICVTAADGLPTKDTIYLSTNNKSPVTAYLPTRNFSVTQGPADGMLDELSSESWSYIPEETFSGQDTFALTDDSLSRVVVVDVFHKESQGQYAIGDTYFTRVDSAITFDVRENDFRVFPIHTYSEPARGSLSTNELGIFTYVPEEGFSGAVAFDYQIKPVNSIESARVVIYVGDMPPENHFTYNITTPKNTPVLINYDIALGNYNMIITPDDGTHGTINLHNGHVDDLIVGCDTVSGYDLITYTPNTDYIGEDIFDIQYCVQMGDCHRVSVKVLVTGDENLPACNCVDDCVWPGDFNNDGRVDMADLLKLGWHIGDKGPQRSYANNLQWIGQYAPSWETASAHSEMNLKYIDGNGDGVISEADTQAIAAHFLRHHDLIPIVKGLKADHAFTIVPPEGTLDSGDLAVFKIEIGSESDPVLDMHGLQFALNLPDELYAENSVEIHFEDSWLTHDAPSLSMHEEPWHGRLEVGFTRASGASASGAGRILIMTFIVVDDIDGFFPPGITIPFKVAVDDISFVGSDGMHQSLDPTAATFFYRTPGAAEDVRPLSINSETYVFPNPASELVNVHVNGTRTLKQVELYDLNGRLLNNVISNLKQAELDISAFPNGQYVLRIVTTENVETRKLTIAR